MRPKGNFELVKNFLRDMEIAIIHEDKEREMVVVENEDEGIKNMIIDCESPLVIVEQFIMNLRPDDTGFFKRLLQMNREMVHGAFALDETGEKLVYRNTLQLESLDFNELESSIKSLGLALSEFGGELLAHARM